MKRILIIQDLCVFGKTDESVSIPIFSSMKMETVFVPIYLQVSKCISNNELKIDLSDKLSVYKDFFIENKIHFDCIFISGDFLDEQIIKINDFIDFVSTEDCLIFSNLLSKYNETLFKRSNISILNFRDVKFLFNINDDINRELSKEVFEGKIRDLDLFYSKKIIIKDFPINDKKTCTISYDEINDKINWIYHTVYNTSFYGLETIFASVVCGFILSNISLEDAVRKAISFTEKSIKKSLERSDYNWYGVDFECILSELTLESF